MITRESGPVAGVLAGADLGGLLTGNGAGAHHVLTAEQLPADVLPATWQGRAVTGLHVKRHGCPPARQAALAAALAGVAAAPALRAVPSQVVGEHVVSLHLGDTVDLGRVLGQAHGTVVSRVHGACLASLTAFAGRDDELRAFIGERTAYAAPVFPVLERYRRALGLAAEVLGGVDLPSELPWPSSPRRILFCDPKPANFLDHPDAGREGDPEPVRIDLDLMHWECELSLQIVLVLFAHPVRANGGTTPAARFDVLRAQAREVGAGLGIGGQEMDSMILYHLLRNFTSAAVDGDRAKARAMAPVFRRAVETIAPAAPGHRTRRLLTDWMAAHDGGSGTSHLDGTEAGPWR